MVFFVIGGHYHKGDTSIIVTGIEKDHIRWMREKGHTEYRSKLYYARMKYSKHVIQYIRLDNQRIYSLNGE